MGEGDRDESFDVLARALTFWLALWPKQPKRPKRPKLKCLDALWRFSSCFDVSARALTFQLSFGCFSSRFDIFPHALTFGSRFHHPNLLNMPYLPSPLPARSEDLPARSEGHPAWGGDWRTDENLPILQDFVPYRGRCPKTSFSRNNDAVVVWWVVLMFPIRLCDELSIDL